MWTWGIFSLKDVTIRLDVVQMFQGFVCMLTNIKELHYSPFKANA